MGLQYAGTARNGSRRVIALDGGWESPGEAEHAALEYAARLGRRVVSACTHLTRRGDRGAPRVAVTVMLDGDRQEDSRTDGEAAGPPSPDLAPEEQEADLVRAHATGTSGRAFVFPGSESLTGVLTVAEVMARSDVDDVVVPGGISAPPDVLLDTQGAVRPEWSGGRLVLCIRPAGDGRMVPFG